jgi:DNA-binding LacI/PurR family transcriptional regulator
MSAPPLRITIYDIARHCGVSKSTVSLALLGDARVHAATAARVHAAATALGYDPSLNHIARRLASRRHGQRVLNRTVGLIIPDNFTEDPYFLRVFQGLWATCRDAGFDLLIIHTPAVAVDTPHELPAAIAHGDVDGLVIFETTGVAVTQWLPRLRTMAGFGDRPIVSILQTAPGVTGAVLIDETTGAYEATRHLLQLGHRQLLQFAPSYAPGLHAERLAGITRALQDCNLDVASHLTVVYVNAEWLETGTVLDAPLPVASTPTSPPLPFPAFMHAHPALTGMLAWNDACAIHALRQLNQSGVRVPEGISIIGHDDTTPLPDECGHNRLTSLSLPLRAMGEAAGRLLLAYIHGTADAIPEVILTPSLLLRQTTGPRQSTA